MAAVIRIKRRYNEEPSNVLVIACKRNKTTEDEEDENASYSEPVTSIAKLAGTIKTQDEDSIKNFAKTVNKDELKENYKKHVVDIKNIMRARMKNDSIQNRYKVINCSRSLDPSNSKESEDNMTVIDVEDSFSCSNQKDENTDTSSNNFVYDLYYTDNDLYYLDDDILYIHDVEQELIFDTDLNSEPEYSSDDSNAEAKCEGYPDTEEEEEAQNSDDDSYDWLCAGVNRCALNDDYKDAELDSDYSIDDDSDINIYQIDNNDIDKYGYEYAHYKALMNHNLYKKKQSSNELEYDYEDIDYSISNDNSNSDSDSD